MLWFIPDRRAGERIREHLNTSYVMVHLEEIYEIFIKGNDLNTSYVMVHPRFLRTTSITAGDLNTSYVMVHLLPNYNSNMSTFI